MPDTREVRSLGVAGPGDVAVFDLTERGPAGGEFWVRTRWSGVSAGTELTYVKGTNPFLHRRFDPDVRVFTEGEPSQRFPVHVMGYMEVGEVTESHTPQVAPGCLVAMTYGHRTAARGNPDTDVVVPVPERLDPVLGIYLAQMGPICANGLLHAAAEVAGPDADDLGAGVVGRNVVVMGAGVVGLLTALFARHLGAAEVLVADHTAIRLDVVERLGLTPVDLRRQELWRVCAGRWRHGHGDAGADVAFQCRGRATALHDALKALRRQGSVIDLAFYDAGADVVRLGEEFHHNGLTIRCAQIGRVPRGLQDRWDRRRLAAATADLLLTHGDVVRRHIVTDVVPFDEAATFLEDLAGRRRHTIQAVLAMS